jgi:hypothetical protein
MPVSDTPIYHELLLERAIKDPEGVALVEGIHERLQARADPHGIIAREEAKRRRLEARPAAADTDTRITQAVLRASRAGFLGLFR